MGIVNLTPDSFSDGGLHGELGTATYVTLAMQHCERLIKEGAHILDIGGESSRPGATPVPLELELARVLPVLRHAVTLGVPISVDTYKPAVMQAALDMGADIINDIWALRQPNASAVVAQHPSCGVCLMHMHGDPQTMQAAPIAGDAVLQVLSFLKQAAQRCFALGIEKTRLVVDPGIGFGKTPAQNFSLLARQQELIDALGLPLLAGWSRKSSLADVNENPSNSTQLPQPHPRLIASVAAAVMAVVNGASIVRVHDVHATAAALRVWSLARKQALR